MKDLFPNLNYQKYKSISISKLDSYKPQNYHYSCGILIEASKRGKGYSKEALKLMLDKAFKTIPKNYCASSYDDICCRFTSFYNIRNSVFINALKLFVL